MTTLINKSRLSPRLPAHCPIKKVLIVEDDAGMRFLIRQALAPRGFMCLEAEDGMTAMNILEDRHVDLIITDYELPGWDGLELLRQIARRPRLARSKTIFLSGKADDEVFLALVRHKVVDAVITKPFEVQQFTKMIFQLLEKPHRDSVLVS